MKHIKRFILSACTPVFFLSVESARAQVTANPHPLPTCSPALFERSCTDLSKAPLDLRKTRTETDGVLFNYFLLGKRTHARDLSNFSTKTTNANRERALKAGEEARKQALLYVTGGRPESEWSPETAALVLRIKTVAIRTSDAADTNCFSTAEEGLPQATYSAFEHSIGICPGMTKVPTDAIIAAVGHELGHAVSPCAMSRPLVRYKESSGDLGSCLLDEEWTSGGDENGEPLGMDTRLTTSLRDVEYGVAADLTNLKSLLRCGAAELIPGSNVSDISFYRGFSRCMEDKYQTQYNQWLAWEALRRDKLPRTLTPREEVAVGEVRASTPYHCFRKCDEHFADSFGSHVLSQWGRDLNSTNQPNLNATRFKHAIHDLITVHCLGTINKRNMHDPILYPSDADRLSLQMQPKAAQELLGCTPPKRNTLCTLSEESFTPSSPTNTSQPNARGNETSR
ncbi:MAG: hypothetical protein RBT63_07995 [Bdellovibrionales bacterium]|nr:hypothetical protein [Bdellovibrionales bacterium]